MASIFSGFGSPRNTKAARLISSTAAPPACPTADRLDDYKIDYGEFSEKISDEHFPRDHYWLMMGPTGPRHFRLAIEHPPTCAASCYFLDLDPRWVKSCSPTSNSTRRAPMEHVVDQAVTILKHRRVASVHNTEAARGALEKINLWKLESARFCGGTTMAPQYVHFLVEEVLENRIGFYPPTAIPSWVSPPASLAPEDSFSVTTTRRSHVPCCGLSIRTNPPSGG
jgi:hypothetical protein